MDSIFATMFLAIQAQIKTLASVKWIDQDLGQLENYGDRPPVKFPCVLLDFETTEFSNLGQLAQVGEGTMLVRLAFAPFSHSNGYTPDAYRQLALEYYNIEHNLHLKLQGFGSEKFGPMMRVSAVTEERNDAIRVRQLRYTISFEDVSTIVAPTEENTFPRPPLEVKDRRGAVLVPPPEPEPEEEEE